MIDVQLPPPSFADARSVVAQCFAELRFPEDVSVSQAARRHRILSNPGAYSGPWGDGPHDVTFLDRIMDALGGESSYREVAVMGPAQTGKSEIGNNWQLQSIIYDPADMLFVMPDRTSIDSYVKTQFNKMLDLTPELRERQLDGPGADTINLKQFRGADLHFLWPTGPTFRARPISRGRLDDFDDIPQDISEQGDALSLMRGRMGSFSAYGRTKIYINSTPKLGKRAGIEAIVAAGTDEHLYVDCLACGHPFALYAARLQFDNGGSPADASASAMVLCPDGECGGVHLPRDKKTLLKSARWVGRGEKAVSRGVDPTGKTGELNHNMRASFRLDGLFGFRSWSEIAEIGRAAEITFDVEQDEAALKAYDQTIIGRNFITRLSGDPEVTEDSLKTRAKNSGYAMGEVPPEAICLIAAVDQQVNRFEVGIWAFGAGFRTWLVDRFPILTMGGVSDQSPRPFSRAEDWSVIYDRVMTRTWPIAGAPHLRMKLLNTVPDTGGSNAGDERATDNAYAWWFSMVMGDIGSGRAPITPTAITLFKGGNNPKAKAILGSPTIVAKRQLKGAPQAELYVPNVNRIKDILNERLKRQDDGPGYTTFPNNVPDAYLAELKSESKNGEIWQREPHQANETWDTLVMAYTVILRFGGNDASLGWVPEWARPPKGAPKSLPKQAMDMAEENKSSKIIPIQPQRRIVVPQNQQRKGRRIVRAA